MSYSNSGPARKYSSSNTSYRRVIPLPTKTRNNRNPDPKCYLVLFLLMVSISFLVRPIFFSDKGKTSPTIVDGEGKIILSPDRQEKLDKELDEIDHAQQYALIATVDQYYPCYTCPSGSSTIFLHKGEVWRYGTTRKGEQGRYPRKNFGVSNIVYVGEFYGTYSECLKMEKIKIYNYPLLPEAQKRQIKLFRPPGNANDN